LVAVDLLLVLATSAPFAYVPLRFSQTATFLRHHPGRVYTDEPGIRVMLADSSRVVADAPRLPPQEMHAWLRQQRVRWVVYSEVDYSPLGDSFPWMRQRESHSPFSLTFVAPSNRWPLPGVYVYALDGD
jgi:hypothetical protein